MWLQETGRSTEQDSSDLEYQRQQDKEGKKVEQAT